MLDIKLTSGSIDSNTSNSKVNTFQIKKSGIVSQQSLLKSLTVNNNKINLYCLNDIIIAIACVINENDVFNFIKGSICILKEFLKIYNKGCIFIIKSPSDMRIYNSVIEKMCTENDIKVTNNKVNTQKHDLICSVIKKNNTTAVVKDFICLTFNNNTNLVANIKMPHVENVYEYFNDTVDNKKITSCWRQCGVLIRVKDLNREVENVNFKQAEQVNFKQE